MEDEVDMLMMMVVMMVVVMMVVVMIVVVVVMHQWSERERERCSDAFMSIKPRNNNTTLHNTVTSNAERDNDFKPFLRFLCKCVSENHTVPHF